MCNNNGVGVMRTKFGLSIHDAGDGLIPFEFHAYRTALNVFAVFKICMVKQ